MTPHEKALEAAARAFYGPAGFDAGAGPHKTAAEHLAEQLERAITAYRAAMRAEGFRQVKVPEKRNDTEYFHTRGWNEAIAETLATEAEG